MAYKKLEDANDAIKGISPKVSLEQANEIAAMADAIEKEGGADNAWAAAITKFKKSYTVRKGAWVDRKTAKMPAKSSENLAEMYGEEYRPTYGATSFDQLDALRAAQETANEIGEITQDFMSMLSNVVWGNSADKLSEFKTLMSEYTERGLAMLGGGASPDGMGEVSIGESYASEPADIVFTEGDGKSSLAHLNVKVIRPGWGNKKDNNFYPAEMLKANANRFIGAKMYETDHKPDEKSTRTWVSTIEKIVGFDDEGSPIARVAVHDPNFAERVRNLNEAGMLNKMECSIMGSASGTGFEKGGRRGRLIENINSISSVDWVTKAGAGGHALALAEKGDEVMEENEQTQDVEPTAPQVPEDAQNDEQAPKEPLQEEQPSKVADAKVLEMLNESKLPKRSQERIALSEYETEEAVQVAIKDELDYIAELTKSGEVFGMAENNQAAPKSLSVKERDALIDKANAKYLK